jgi:hypothetical protein
VQAGTRRRTRVHVHARHTGTRHAHVRACVRGARMQRIRERLIRQYANGSELELSSFLFLDSELRFSSFCSSLCFAHSSCSAHLTCRQCNADTTDQKHRGKRRKCRQRNAKQTVAPSVLSLISFASHRIARSDTQRQQTMQWKGSDNQSQFISPISCHVMHHPKRHTKAAKHECTMRT